jgi:hypothetical protein
MWRVEEVRCGVRIVWSQAALTASFRAGDVEAARKHVVELTYFMRLAETIVDRQ